MSYFSGEIVNNRPGSERRVNVDNLFTSYCTICTVTQGRSQVFETRGGGMVSIEDVIFPWKFWGISSDRKCFLFLLSRKRYFRHFLESNVY
jgi:hypothetical protein